LVDIMGIETEEDDAYDEDEDDDYDSWTTFKSS
jgi:hypothetical protein